MKLRAAESILENTFPDVDVAVEIDVAGAGARLPAPDEDPCSAEFLFTKQVVRSEFDAGKVLAAPVGASFTKETPLEPAIIENASVSAAGRGRAIRCGKGGITILSYTTAR